MVGGENPPLNPLYGGLRIVSQRVSLSARRLSFNTHDQTLSKRKELGVGIPHEMFCTDPQGAGHIHISSGGPLFVVLVNKVNGDNLGWQAQAPLKQTLHCPWHPPRRKSYLAVYRMRYHSYAQGGQSNCICTKTGHGLSGHEDSGSCTRVPSTTQAYLYAQCKNHREVLFVLEVYREIYKHPGAQYKKVPIYYRLAPSKVG